VLGLIGKPRDRRVTSRSVDTEKVSKITADLVVEALASLGIAELNKAIAKPGPKAIGFTSPITRDGPGFRADVDLPGGVTAEQVISQRARLASGLRRPISCVWPEGDSEAHAGRLILWVGDKPMSQSKPAAWPHAKGGKVDLFQPFPIGVDPRGQTVTTTLMFASMIVGALPRMGKTFMLRLVLLAAALDPTVQLHIYDLKGGADFLPLEPVAHRFRIGDDPDDVDYMLADLRELKDDLTRRYKVLRSLPRDICPEGKVTRDLANRRDLGLFPIVFAADECQRMFEHDTHGKEMEAIVTDLAKRGPAAGIIVICATQRPDAKSLPSGISTNAVLRFCLKVMRQIENDMVLGTGMHSSGITATMFQRSDRGIGYLVGEGDDPIITRVYYVDGPGAEAVAKRARETRQKAGLLTGHAIGQESGPQDETPQDSILDHLAMVWPAGKDKSGSQQLADRLATTYPSIYEGWDGAQVSSAVSKDMTSRQVWVEVAGKGSNLRGFYRSDLDRAIARRQKEAERLAVVSSTPRDSVSPPSLGLAEPLGVVLGASEHEKAHS
jgi:S-DNA-T family DNA segregation ATPase FtsK/SpoIIIE